MGIIQIRPELRLCVIHSNRKLMGYQGQWHTHSFFELGIVFEGACDWQIRGQRTRHLKSGQMILVPPDCWHREEASERVRLGWVGFQCDMKFPARQILRAISQEETVTDFRYLLTRLYAEQQLDRFGSAEICTLTLEHLILLFQRAAQTQARPPREKTHSLNARQIQIVQSLATYLDRNATQPLSLNQLANYHHLSAPHLSVLFQSYYQTTPTRYRLQKRIESAGELLAHGSQSVKEIATACGFTDAAHFCKEFKRQTGQTPTQVRDGGDFPGRI